LSIRKGDQVVVIAGKDKGKKGKVIYVDPEDQTVIVDGVNIIIKHRKAKNQKQKSGRDKKAGAIHVSNVQILCKCGKATRVGHKIENGKKNRVCAKCGEVLDKKFVKVKEKTKEEAVVEDKDTKEKVDKKPLQRREVRAHAESNIKRPQNVKTVSGHRKLGGE
jgi:large subunit ribosomal protein L24